MLYVFLGVHKCSNSCSLSYYRVPAYNIFAITVIIIEKVVTESLMFIARKCSVMHMVKNSSEYAENTSNKYKKNCVSCVLLTRGFCLYITCGKIKMYKSIFLPVALLDMKLSLST